MELVILLRANPPPKGIATNTLCLAIAEYVSFQESGPMRLPATLLLVCASFLLPDRCCAKQWADDLFETKSHSFGSVGRGVKAEFEFKLTNPFMEEIEIASASTSCGCTSVEIKKRVLKTYESGTIRAKLNTHLFLGKKGATITVNFSRPQRASVRLRVDGTIYNDLIVSPSSADLGTVDHGTPAQKTVSVRYAGRQGLQIVDVKTENPHLKAKIVPVRGVAQGSYELLVRLDAEAPSGYIRDSLLLVTTNSQLRQIPIMVEARVVPDVTLTPSTLFLGVLKPGETVTKNIVVRGRQPFVIKSIRADREGVVFGATGETARLIHVVPVTVVAGEEAGALVHRVTIETDVSGERPQLSSYAVVQP